MTLGSRLCLGRHCREALLRCLSGRDLRMVDEAEPRKQCVPRRSLGTRKIWLLSP
jgi:hypothetical protein